MVQSQVHRESAGAHERREYQLQLSMAWEALS